MILINSDSINKFIIGILEQTISSEELSKIIKKKWINKNFVEQYDDINALRQEIWHLSFDKLVTEHGRVEDQPLSVSQHLFGDNNSIAARVAYDPPKKNEAEYIEYHTHPVDSVIVVLDGECTYSLIYKYEYIINISLKPGFFICFPDNVIHTIKEISNDGLETLNITNKMNQPPYRIKFHQNKNLFINSSDNFSEHYEIGKMREIAYKDFIEISKNK